MKQSYGIMLDMTPKEVLLGAAAYIEQHGILYDDYGVDGGPRCVAGAIESVCQYPVDYSLTEIFDDMDKMFRPYFVAVEKLFPEVNEVITERQARGDFQWYPEFQDYMITWVDEFKPLTAEVVERLVRLADEI